MREYLDVPAAIVRRVRTASAHLPEAYEEQLSQGFGGGSAGTLWPTSSPEIVGKTPSPT
jgi:hypothetical protein